MGVRGGGALDGTPGVGSGPVGRPGLESLSVSNRGGQLFGVGLGVGILVGLILGSILAALLGDEAAEAFRSVADRVARRRESVHFEALLQ